MGEPLSLVLARLGLPLNALINIRRRRGWVTKGNSRETQCRPKPNGEDADLRNCPHGNIGKHVENEETVVGGSWVGEREIGLIPARGNADHSSGGGKVDSVSLFVLGRKQIMSPFASLRRRAYARLDGDAGSSDFHIEGSVVGNGSAPPLHSHGGSSIQLTSVSQSITTSATDRINYGMEEDNSGTCQSNQAASTSDRNRHSRSHGVGIDGDSTDRTTQNFGGVHRFHCSASEEKVRAGDVLTLSCMRLQMMDFQGLVVSHGKMGLKILGVATRDLLRRGTTFYELCLSGRSDFVGRSARQVNATLAARYGCRVVGFRLKGIFSAVGDGVTNPPGDGELGRDGVDTGVGLARPHGNECQAKATAKAMTTVSEGVVATQALDSGSELKAFGQRDTAMSSPTIERNPMQALARPSAPSSRLPRAGGTRADAHDPPVEATPKRLECDDTARVSVRQQQQGRKRARRRGTGFVAGDVVMVLAKEDFLERFSGSPVFLSKTRVGRLPEPTSWFHYFPLLIFAAMLAWVLASDVSMVSTGEGMLWGVAGSVPDRTSPLSTERSSSFAFHGSFHGQLEGCAFCPNARYTAAFPAAD